MLDLQPERSVVRNFLQAGIDLYMIDWGYPSRKDKYLTIDDHVNGYMDNIVDHIRQRCDVDKVNLMGICMGGTFCVIYSALHPDKVKNLITTVCPTNFDTDQGLLHIWMKDVDVDKMIDLDLGPITDGTRVMVHRLPDEVSLDAVVVESVHVEVTLGLIGPGVSISDSAVALLKNALRYARETARYIAGITDSAPVVFPPGLIELHQ